LQQGIKPLYLIIRQGLKTTAVDDRNVDLKMSGVNVNNNSKITQIKILQKSRKEGLGCMCDITGTTNARQVKIEHENEA
jgi:hypothetical protein